MAGDSGQNSFRRGVMSLVILGLLKREDMYGYQLVQETERISGTSRNCRKRLDVSTYK